MSDPRRPGLYLHVPFCAAICPYCDFAVARGDARARERFAAALIAEIEASAATAFAPGAFPSGASPPGAFPPGAFPPGFDTVYLGGGTPSFLAPEELDSILRAVRRALPIAAGAWVTMEANPEDVTAEAAAAWRALGVDGLSLGVQSFDARVLRALGRAHDGAAARRAVELALEAGFAWVSLDLIYGTPPRTAAQWDPLAVALGDVESAVALGPHHVSCYQLTVHEGTPFGGARARGRLRELDDDAQASLFAAVHEALEAGGYPAYEVSNFARGAAHRSRHNTKYWEHVPYLGLGPSAHSFDGEQRWWNLRDWREWATAIEAGSSPRAGGEVLGRAELALETLMLGLRTTDGIDVDRFRERHGVDLLAAGAARVARAFEEGLLRSEGSRLFPTTRGMAVADALAASFDLDPLR